jgi:hypothetical protein
MSEERRALLHVLEQTSEIDMSPGMNPVCWNNAFEKFEDKNMFEFENHLRMLRDRGTVTPAFREARWCTLVLMLGRVPTAPLTLLVSIEGSPLFSFEFQSICDGMREFFREDNVPPMLSQMAASVPADGISVLSILGKNQEFSYCFAWGKKNPDKSGSLLVREVISSCHNNRIEVTPSLNFICTYPNTTSMYKTVLEQSVVPGGQAQQSTSLISDALKKLAFRNSVTR